MLEARQAIADLRKSPQAYSDFIGADAAVQSGPFAIVPIGSGTTASNNSPAGHPGILRLSSSTNADSGNVVRSGTNHLLLQPGDYFECIFNIVTLALTTIRVGFLDTVSVADVTDGAYFEIAATGVVSAKTANNGTRTTAPPLPTLALATWYRAEIEIQSATEARFRLFNSDTGALVFPETTIATNIPTAAGRNCGAGIIATNSGTSALALVDLDWMGYENRAGYGIVR